MYILQERPKGNFVEHQWIDSKSNYAVYDTRVIQADTISVLVNMIIQAEFNPDNNLEWRVIERTPVAPVVSYKEKVV